MAAPTRRRQAVKQDESESASQAGEVIRDQIEALACRRVRDVPDGREPFQSKIIRRYQRRSDTIDETFMKLFIEGLAMRDFEPALRLLRGEQAPLSASVISRLTQRFRATYESFEQQGLWAPPH